MSYYWIDNTPQLKYAICDKCNDRYVMYSGRFSQRRSCRRHDWKNGFCRDCHLKKIVLITQKDVIMVVYRYAARLTVL